MLKLFSEHFVGGLELFIVSGELQDYVAVVAGGKRQVVECHGDVDRRIGSMEVALVGVYLLLFLQVVVLGRKESFEL